MGWRIETNNVDKWDVISSVVDDVIISFNNEDELKLWLAVDFIYEGKKKAVETLLTFPNNWTINEKSNRGAGKKYYEWLESLDEFKTYEEYYKAIDDKLAELTGELNNTNWIF